MNVIIFPRPAFLSEKVAIGVPLRVTASENSIPFNVAPPEKEAAVVPLYILLLPESPVTVNAFGVTVQTKVLVSVPPPFVAEMEIVYVPASTVLALLNTAPENVKPVGNVPVLNVVGEFEAVIVYVSALP